RQILLVNAGNIHRIYSLSDLVGKVVATQAGSNAEAFINEHENLKKSFAVFRTYHDLQEGFETLRKEHFYVLIIDEIAARYEMNKHPGDFEIIEATVGPTTEFGIGFSKDNVELRDKVQKAFEAIVADGTAKQISMKWFQSDLIKLMKHH
ncbi:MAG: transporter substrate-binding domain-containing protein, partial [Selenomonadaceae bacterium]|nr:transporter substrate-binding domain-containing protein [Selenomonadaceae bacterium]